MSVAVGEKMFHARELFDRASVGINGPVAWHTPIPELRPGVYVVTLVEVPKTPPVLPKEEAIRWIADQEILYIGKATNLRDRLGQFYSHKHGNRAPHRGGQAIKLLDCPMQVYWGPVLECEAMETFMLRTFISEVGTLPFANRKRGSSKIR